MCRLSMAKAEKEQERKQRGAPAAEPESRRTAKGPSFHRLDASWQREKTGEAGKEKSRREGVESVNNCSESGPSERSMHERIVRVMRRRQVFYCPLELTRASSCGEAAP